MKLMTVKETQKKVAAKVLVAGGAKNEQKRLSKHVVDHYRSSHSFSSFDNSTSHFHR